MPIPSLPWIQRTASLLLILTLTACSRSASTTLTPLPSAPPPTPTDIASTQSTSLFVTADATEGASEAPATSEPTEKPTATKAVPATSATSTEVLGAAACTDAPTTRLKVGMYAYVNPDPPLPNNVRSGAGQEHEITGYIEPGQAMEILEGPECADGSAWWKVRTLETDLTGWTAEGDEQGYWLVPCLSQEECGP